MTKRTLVIGYGNIDRSDDGIAYFIVNALRKALGQSCLREDQTGLEELGTRVDSIFLLQLTPEMIDVIAPYDQIIFVDAHVFESKDNLYYETVRPEYGASTFTHHITPGMLLALMKMIYDKEPAGHIISVRGHNFDFARVLSPETKALIKPAVDKIRSLI